MIDVTIIGFGNVGSALALLLLNNKHPLRLNVQEPDPQKEGAFLDLAHGMSLFREKELHVNDEDLFLNADFIFYTAGTPNVPGGSRLAMAKQNTQLSKEIFEHRMFVKTPYVIVITNPVDVVSHSVYKYSELPSDHIIGTGTFLDSIRLAYYLSRMTDYPAADFEAWVLGEHGASQVPVFSKTKLNGQSILEKSIFTSEQLEEAQQQTKNAANKIRETQDGTKYGVAKCAEVIFDCILNKEEMLLPLSQMTNEYYRELLRLDHDIYISLPVILKNGNVEISHDLQLSEEELEAFRKSAAILAEVIG